MTEAGTGAPTAPSMGMFQKLIGVYFSPGKTFEAVATKPGWDWLLPVILMMVGVFAVQKATIPKIDVEEAVAMNMKIVDRMNRNMPEAERAKAEEATREATQKEKDRGGSPFAPLFVLLPVLAVSGIYHGIAVISGKGTSFKRVLAGYAWVQCISLLALLLTIVVAIPQTALSMIDIQTGRLLKSNIAAFLDFDSTSKVLLALLSSVDVFDIWYFVINSIALSKTTRFSSKQAMAVVGSVWGLYIVVKMIAAAVYSYMLG